MPTQDDQPTAPWLSVAEARTRPEMFSQVEGEADLPHRGLGI